MLGNFVLSSGYYDAYFTKAQKVRRLIANKTQQMLNKDVIISTTPSTAFNIGAIKDPITMYLQDIFTVHANIVGLLQFHYLLENIAACHLESYGWKV